MAPSISSLVYLILYGAFIYLGVYLTAVNFPIFLIVFILPKQQTVLIIKFGLLIKQNSLFLQLKASSCLRLVSIKLLR